MQKRISQSRLKRRLYSDALVQLQPELLVAIEAIAQQEQRPVEHVANELVAFALTHHQSAEHSLDVWQRLTKREQDVTAHIWLGLSNGDIAARLNISKNTVKTHIRNVLAKFDAHSKAELRHRLIGIDFSEWVAAMSPNGVNS